MTMPRIAAIGVLAAACACGPAAIALSADAASPATSRTARVLEDVVARAAPSASGRKVLALKPYTAFSRTDQVLMVTGDATDESGAPWLRVALPMRPNGTTGWVPASAVRVGEVNVKIRVRLGARRLEIWRSGRREFSTPAAVGTGATPTPVGRFAVQDPVGTGPQQRATYGPYIITLTAYSQVLRSFMGGNGLVAIHGTSDTSSLGRAASHGCVRVSNRALRTVRRAASAGVPVEIVPS